MTTIYNLSKMAGDSESIEITVLDEDGAAFDLTGATIQYVAKTGVSASTNAILLSTTAGDIAILANVATITFAPADTETMAAGNYYMECEAVLPDTRVFTLFTGLLTIQASGV